MGKQHLDGEFTWFDNGEPYFSTAPSTMTLDDGTKVEYVLSPDPSTCPFPIMAMTFDRRLTETEREVVKSFMGFPETA